MFYLRKREESVIINSKHNKFTHSTVFISEMNEDALKGKSNRRMLWNYYM